jgi:hypothetical protein
MHPARTLSGIHQVGTDNEPQKVSGISPNQLMLRTRSVCLLQEVANDFSKHYLQTLYQIDISWR